MLVRLRAVMALAMIAGIFVLGGFALGILLAATVWALGLGGVGLLLALVLVAAAFAVGAALFVVGRSVPVPPEGLSVSVMAEPELWATVKDAASAVGSRSPDELRLVADGGVRVTEESRFLGLLSGIRVLSIGVPVLQAATRADLVWALCHELGHDSERHPPLSGALRRGLAGLTRLADDLEGRRPFEGLLRPYLAVYGRIVHAHLRPQELDADRWATAVTGAGTGVSALRTLAVTGSTWHAFDRDYGSVGAGAGVVPEGLFAGYSVFLSDPSRSRVDPDRLVADQPRSAYDTHPDHAERTDRLRALAAASAGVQDGRPALSVLADPGRTLGEVEVHLIRQSRLAPVAWDRAVQLGNRHRDEERATRLMDVVQRLADGGGDLGQALRLAGAEQKQLTRQLAGHATDDGRDVLRAALASLVRAALVGAGHASYVHRWDRSDVVVDEAGVEVDVAGLVAGVPGDPRSAAWLIDVLGEEGISPTWTPGDSSPAPQPELS